MILSIAVQMPPIEFPINPLGIAAVAAAAGAVVLTLTIVGRGLLPSSSKRSRRHR